MSFFIFLLLTSPAAVLGQDKTVDKYGGTVVLAGSDPKSFNDILAKETTTTMVTGHIFEGLTF